ncbi:transposase family protein [Arachnia propionica]|uniref:transposase family protein n=1 Tax=Arachnia propionica TaxID=1750 RepID=UPI00399CC881
MSCWSWSKRPELYSGTHHTTGVNLQVACTLAGHLAWICPPLPGSVHDAKAIKESEFLTTLNGQSHIGDKKAYSQTARQPEKPLVSAHLGRAVNRPQRLHRIGNEHPREETRPW